MPNALSLNQGIRALAQYNQDQFEGVFMTKINKQGLLRSTMLGAAIAFGGIAPAMMATTAFAQDYTSGGVEGNVGSAGAGVTVTLTSNGRGFSRTSVTDANGNYRFSRLPIGNYTLSANGISREDVKVSVNSVGNYNLSSSEDEIVTTSQIVSSALASDFSVNQTGITLDVEETFKTQPLARNLTALALFAPGTTGGDSAFGNLASISGSSVAENAYYINGMNITDFRNFVGASSVPFEFYDQVETKTGGYSAEFGRSTGGVVNAVTKSGSNDFHFGVNAYWEPDGLRTDVPNAPTASNVSLNNFDTRDNLDANIWASGPIIKDRLFFFGLYNHQDFESNNTSIRQNNSTGGDISPDFPAGGTLTRTTNDSPFYGAKIDAVITDDHLLEYTFIRDESVTVSETADVTFDASGSITSTVFEDGTGNAFAGGDTHIGKYTGNFGENLTVSALYGHQKINQTVQSSADSSPVIVNFGGTSGLPFFAGDWINFNVSSGNDTRELMRADLDYYLDDFGGDHHFRIGVDREKLTAIDTTINSGGVYYAYFPAASCDNFATLSGAVPANHTAGSDCVREREYSTGGSFETIQTAFYLQDSWKVSDNLTLNLGIRNETFDNRDALGNTFTKISNQWAPRLGFAYTAPNNENIRFTGSVGRYFLPVAANTNIRLAGAETFIHTYEDLVSVNADDTPNTTGSNFLTRVTGSGEVGETASLVNADLQAMYVDEIIFGVSNTFDRPGSALDGWDASLNVTFRDLASTLEDVAIDAAVLKWCAREGITGCESVWTGFHQYVLTNPGFAMNVSSLTSDVAGLVGPGGQTYTQPLQIELTAEDLGYPEASRYYAALDLRLKKGFDWGYFDLSYTLSESRGNYEGSVKSDNGQDDAGITQDFDQPGLVDGARGPLPNHRAHKLKVRSSYNIGDEMVIGANYRLTSPRKYGCIGLHPTDGFAQAYGAASNYCGGQLVPRGTAFEGKWLHQLDASFAYTPGFVADNIGGELTIRADVFNIFNLDGPTDFNEFGEDDSGTARASYGLASQYQAPRRVRLGVSYEF